jgi:4-hydroxy-3-methylbut-2-enyl diphosphate reductase IspH
VTTYLIDGPNDIDLNWFVTPETSKAPSRPAVPLAEQATRNGGGSEVPGAEETVMITAGASAPEAIVQECVSILQQRLGASVETRTIRQEQLRFALPKL